MRFPYPTWILIIWGCLNIITLYYTSSTQVSFRLYQPMCNLTQWLHRIVRCSVVHWLSLLEVNGEPILHICHSHPSGMCLIPNEDSSRQCAHKVWKFVNCLQLLVIPYEGELYLVLDRCRLVYHFGGESTVVTDMRTVAHAYLHVWVRLCI